MWPRSVPRVFDMMQVYFPASAGPASTTIRSWLAAAKKWRSVSTRGPSSLVQLRRGAGLPPAIHWSTAVSPRATVRSSSGRMKDGVSEREEDSLIFDLIRIIPAAVVSDGSVLGHKFFILRIRKSYWLYTNAHLKSDLRLIFIKKCTLTVDSEATRSQIQVFPKEMV